MGPQLGTERRENVCVCERERDREREGERGQQHENVHSS